MRYRKNYILPLIACILCMTGFSRADAQIIVEPIFEYPVAPDDIENLNERSSWLVTHFWDNMDLNTDTTVDQNALNHAFFVYTSAMQFADRDSALKSVDALLKRIKGKPALTMQFVKAAEETLYGPRADIWSDEVYIPFLKALGAEKNVSQIRKERYARQLDLLQNTQPGKKAPAFRYRLTNGHYKDLKVDRPFTIIEFGDPECDDCAFAKLKLEMAADIQDLIADKQLQILFIVPDVAADEETEVMDALKTYPAAWTTGIGYGIEDAYDIRQTPSFYLLNSKGEIIIKNRDVMTTVDTLREHLQNGKKGK